MYRSHDSYTKDAYSANVESYDPRVSEPKLAPHREAAAILRRIVKLLNPPASVAAYLRGHADGLEARRPRSKKPED